MTSPRDLAGRGVLVTRPTGQAQRLCDLIEQAGGRAIVFPTVQIAPASDPRPASTLLGQTWDIAIFVSKNAVEQALILAPDGQGTWPRVGSLAAVGHATATALERAGRMPDLVPNGRFDSESLLALPELRQIAGNRVLIVRGEGGLSLLKDTLTERGARVEYAEVYRRTRPHLDPSDLLRQWNTTVHLVIATSDAVLLNLMEILGEPGRAALLNTPLVVISARTAETARDLGFQHVRIAEQADDCAIVDALRAQSRGEW